MNDRSYFEPGIQDEIDALQAEVYFQTRRYNILRHNADCRDPDHPGCEICEESDYEWYNSQIPSHTCWGIPRFPPTQFWEDYG